jgi:hypothetical protein
VELIEAGRPGISALNGQLGVEADRTALTSSSERRWGWLSLLVVLAYLTLGVIAYGPAIPDLNGKLTGVDGDFIQSVWFIGWVPHALDHWLNPFFSGAMYAPGGVNLADNTASPLLGLLTYPVSRLLSPLASANLLMVSAMPLSATAAFVVLRKWNVWGPAAAIGGAIYGFSPYMVGQGFGHVELMFIPIPPLIALTIEEILHRRGDLRWLGIQLGALVSVQFLISPEVTAVVGLLSLVALVCIAVSHRSARRTMADGLLQPVIVAFGVAALVLAYPVWMLVAGPQHFPGPTQPVSNPYYNDMATFVIPGPLQRVSFGLESQWSGPLAFNPTEDGGYIGIPLLVLAAVFAWHSRRRARMQLTVVLLAVSGVLSLGSSLYVGGKATHVPLPFAVLQRTPLLNDILPSRISFATSAFLAAVIAFGLDEWHLRPRPARHDRFRVGRGQPAAAPLLALLTLVALVVSQLPLWPYPITSTSASTSPSASALPARVERAIPRGDPVTITYPYTANPVLQSLLWQSASDYKFSILGGYARRADSGGNRRLSEAGPTLSPMNPPEPQKFLSALSYAGLTGAHPSAEESRLSPRLLQSTRTTLARLRVQVVIVARTWGGALPVLALFREVLGPPDHTVDSYSLWVHVRSVFKQDALRRLSRLRQVPPSRPRASRGAPPAPPSGTPTRRS